jgi:hypothetical protein
MNKELSTLRNQHGERKVAVEETEKDVRRRNWMYLVKTPPELKKNNQDGKFQGISANQLLANEEGAKWRSKRNLNHSKKTNQKHIEFAKNLFLTWDDFGKGTIRAESVVEPLARLGLSESSENPSHVKNFVKTLIAAINREPVSKYELEDIRLDLHTFISMFKSDNVSKTISEIVKSEARQRDLKPLKVPKTPANLQDLNV